MMSLNTVSILLGGAHYAEFIPVCHECNWQCHCAIHERQTPVRPRIGGALALTRVPHASYDNPSAPIAYAFRTLSSFSAVVNSMRQTCTETVSFLVVDGCAPAFLHVKCGQHAYFRYTSLSFSNVERSQLLAFFIQDNRVLSLWPVHTALCALNKPCDWDVTWCCQAA